MTACVALLVFVMYFVRGASGGAEARDSVSRCLDVTHPRVVVLKSKRRLHLFDGDQLVRIYPIGLGSEPIGQKVKRDDGRTPEGRFTVCTKNAASKYHRFLGISYPDATAARRGLRDGLISYGEFSEIVAAQQSGRCPSWTTPLGGGIGLHGSGAGSDWTAGCIALADEDVEELFAVLRLGDTIEVLP